MYIFKAAPMEPLFLFMWPSYSLMKEFFGISQENYRKKLSSAKKDFQTLASGQCALISKKTLVVAPKK